MGFYNRLMDYISGINAANKPAQNFVFGSIISGTYTNWKTDPHPTILCLGNYQKNGQWYIHGIQLHEAGGNLGWLLMTINSLKQNGAIVTPIIFYNYIKYKAPGLIKYSYRTYLSNMCDFKVVNPGFSNINENYCYPITDERDYFLKRIGTKVNIINMDINSTQLRNNVTAVINSVKVW